MADPGAIFRAVSKSGPLELAVLSLLALADRGEFEYRMAVRLGDEITCR